MHRGFISIWRKVVDNRSWSRGPLHRALLVTLLVKANWKDGYFRGRTIKAGQLATSAASLADELQTPRTTVQRLLSDLKEDGLVTIENVGNRYSLISITNWHTYQGSKNESGLQMSNQWAADGHNQTIKQVNKEKKKEIALPPQGEVTASATDFDTFWKAYPRKVGKKNASTAWAKLQKQKTLPDIESLLAAIERQKQSAQWQDAKYIPHPATWLNGERWSDGAEDGDGGGGVCGSAESRPAWARDMGEIL